MSWLVGPIFVLECVLAARRWQTYAMRTAFLALLLTSLVAAWIWWVPSNNRNSLGRMGEAFFFAIAGTQLVMALLVAPAYFAGRICLEKTRGTLVHMLVTDLSAREIVLGKVGALGSLVFALILAGVPVMILATFLGGIDPEAVIGSFFVTLASAALVSAVALVLSVWGRKPHEVLLAAYLFEAVWLLAWPVWSIFDRTLGMPPTWIKMTNPFAMVFGNYIWAGGLTFEDYALYLGVCFGLAVLLTLLAALTLRWAVCRESERRPWRWGLPRLTFLSPGLDANPVLWREWRRRPSFWLQLIWGIYILGSVGISLASLTPGPANRELPAIVNAFVFSIGLLLMCITTVAAVFEERANGALDILMTTPLSSGSIVWGKWLAGYRIIVPVSVLCMLLASCVALQSGESERLAILALLSVMILAYGTALNSLALALAVAIPRFGVAMGLTVAINVILSAGPVLFAFGPGRHDRGFYALSPWYGVGETTAQITHRFGDTCGWKITWIIAYSLAALALYGNTHRFFDRCMGRVPARS